MAEKQSIIPADAITFVAGGRDSRDVGKGGIREVRGSVGYNPGNINHSGHDLSEHRATGHGGGVYRGGTPARDLPKFDTNKHK